MRLDPARSMFFCWRLPISFQPKTEVLNCNEVEDGLRKREVSLQHQNGDVNGHSPGTLCSFEPPGNRLVELVQGFIERGPVRIRFQETLYYVPRESGSDPALQALWGEHPRFKTFAQQVYTETSGLLEVPLPKFARDLVLPAGKLDVVGRGGRSRELS